MRAILLTLTLLTTLSAFGETRTKTELCIEHLLRDGEAIKLHFNDLIITNEDRIFWKGDPVLLAWDNGSPIRKREKFIRVLSVLVKHPYRILSSKEIFDLSWGAGDFDLREISKPLRILRMNFERVDEHFDAIKNVWREGFMWDDGKRDVITYPDVPEIRINKAKLLWNDQPVNLSEYQRGLVMLLLERRGTPVSNLELYNIGRDEKVESLGKKEMDALKTQISVIRKAFRDKGDRDFDRIQTTNDGSARFWILKQQVRPLEAAE